MKILYCRGNYTRKLQHRIGTMIYQENDSLYVRKYILDEQAKNHLLSILPKEQLIAKNFPKILLNKMVKKDNIFIDFEYLNFPSLELLIEKALIKKEFEKTKDYIIILKKLITNLKTINENPYKNKEFIKIFDSNNKYQSTRKIECSVITILDLNFDNLLLDEKENKIYLIDYEWVYNFPIPKDFLFFRSVLYLCQKLQPIIQTVCSSQFPGIEVLPNFLIPKAWFGIVSFSRTRLSKYRQYELNFQKTVNLVPEKVKKDINVEKSKVVKQRYSQNLESYISFQVQQEVQQQVQQYINPLQKELDELKSSRLFKVRNLYHSFKIK